MSRHVLITGGAGFIGAHLANELLGRGHRVRALDNLSPQVHGEGASRPTYLSPDVELLVGDVRAPRRIRRRPPIPIPAASRRRRDASARSLLHDQPLWSKFDESLDDGVVWSHRSGLWREQ